MIDVQLNGQSITTSGTAGSTAPASGTSETWTVAAVGAGVPALSSGQAYSMMDSSATPGSAAALEIVRVTACDGPGDTSITVTRGADSTTPAAHAAAAVFKIVVVASGLTYPTLPYYAPQGLQFAETWDPRLSSFMCYPPTMHQIRAAVKKLVAATANMDIVCIGDSTLSDYNGSTFTADFTIPRQLGKAMAKMIGDVSFVDGYKHAMQGNLANVGQDVTTTGACTTGITGSNSLLISTGAGTVTWVTRDSGTSVTVLTSDLATTGIAWTIDGVAQTPLVANGAATMRATTVSGLANKTHTIVLSPAAGQSMVFGGVFTFNPSVKQLRVHNLCLGGARVASGTAGQNISDVSGNSSLGSIIQKEITALGITPSLIVLCGGANDAFQSVAAATAAAGLHTIRNFYPTVPFMFVRSIPVTGTNAALYDAYGAAYFTQSEADGAMFFDWNHYVNYAASFVADGLAGADGIHPTDADRIGTGRHIGHIICDMTSPAERSYQLSEVSGSYPARPAGAAAGQVNYTGPDTPPDWLPGDTWDDLP